MYSCKVIGSTHKPNLTSIIDALQNSGLLTEEEMELYF